MATILADPGRMIGLHFFNPAHRMPLLEVICAEKTTDQTLATCVSFGRSIKKIPIVVNDGPGFYVSRQLGGLMGGAIYLAADGVKPKSVARAWITSYRKSSDDDWRRVQGNVRVFLSTVQEKWGEETTDADNRMFLRMAKYTRWMEEALERK